VVECQLLRLTLLTRLLTTQRKSIGSNSDPIQAKLGPCTQDCFGGKLIVYFAAAKWLRQNRAMLRTILVSAMADVGADPALIYAFQKTGVYVCEENEHRLSRSQSAVWNDAVDEYYRTLAGPRQ
jgi:hypothetical protein